MRQGVRALGLWLAIAGGSASAVGPTGIVEFGGAEFVAGGASPPPPTATWERRRLPDNWNRSQPGVGGSGWYRFVVTLPENYDEPWAVELTRVWMNAAVYVNGTRVDGSGELPRYVPTNWDRPLLFTVPASLLRAGANEIVVGVWAYADVRGGLHGAAVGPERTLRPVHERRFFLKVTLIQAFLLAIALMAIFIGLLWLQRRHDSVYGWFALYGCLWTVKTFTFLVRPPHSHLIWAINLWIVFLMLLIVHRFLRVHRPLLERGALAYCALGTLALPALGAAQLPAVGAIMAGAAAIGLYATAFGITEAWRSRRPDALLLALALVAQLLLGVHDLLLLLGLLPYQNWSLMHYGAPLFCLILAWLLTSRFVQALRDSEATVAALERRVEEKRRELERNYARVQELQREQAVAQERERIMRDLHDGLGGQLVSALAISQRDSAAAPAIAQTLRDALDDLRMVIDSLDPVDGDLLVLLGTVRGRFESRLAQHGLRFEWQVADIPAIPGFGPDKALHVLRIVQEAIANILKHANAKAVTVRTGTRPARNGAPASVFIEVTDDGAGLGAERSGGRGLGNMRERAARAGGQLEIESPGHGTTVRLWLPLSHAA